MRGRSRWFPLALGALIRLVALGAVFVLALGLGALGAVVFQRGLVSPGGAGLEQNESTGDATTVLAAVPKEGGEDRNVGVWYDSNAGRWAIFNQDLFGMAEGAAFEVTVVPPGGPAFVHQAADGNTSGESTYLDSPLTNGVPGAVLSVTQSWNPAGAAGGVYNDHPVGARYDAAVNQWAVHNLDGARMPRGASFNVGVSLQGEPVAASFVHRAAAANTSANWTYLDSPLTNGVPGAVLLVARKE